MHEIIDFFDYPIDYNQLQFFLLVLTDTIVTKFL